MFGVKICLIFLQSGSQLHHTGFIATGGLGSHRKFQVCRIIESASMLREGRGNPILMFKICLIFLQSGSQLHHAGFIATGGLGSHRKFQVCRKIIEYASTLKEGQGNPIQSGSQLHHTGFIASGGLGSYRKLQVCRMIESASMSREGRGNPILMFKICSPQWGFSSNWCCKYWTWGLNFLPPFGN